MYPCIPTDPQENHMNADALIVAIQALPYEPNIQYISDPETRLAFQNDVTSLINEWIAYLAKTYTPDLPPAAQAAIFEMAERGGEAESDKGFRGTEERYIKLSTLGNLIRQA
jgi:hypothetical protein